MFSRFSVLNPEVDVDDRLKKKKTRVQPLDENKNKPKSQKARPNNKSTGQNKGNQANKSLKAKKKQEDDDLKSLAFGIGKRKTGKKKGSSVLNKDDPNTVEATSDDTEWKDVSEEDLNLTEALLLSKMDFEEKKNINLGEPKKQKTRKKEKFNSSADSNKICQSDEKVLNGLEVSDEEINVKQSPNITPKSQKLKLSNQYSQEYLKTKYEAEVEKRDFEIQALRLEVDALKNELQSVKDRNKKLCEVISQSEMRSKGQLVLELDKVTKDRDELSQEVARLSGELEQEKTKVSNLTAEIRKTQGRRKKNSESH